MDTPTTTGKNHHNSLRCTLKENPNYKFENCEFLLDQHYIFF